MKVKYKFLLSIISLIVIFSLALNISIRYVLTSKMEETIISSLDQLMYSSREAIKYRILASHFFNESNEYIFQHEKDYLGSYISSNFQCFVEIRNTNEEIINDNVDSLFENVLNKTSEKVNDGSAVVNLKYVNKGLYGILTYPIMINEEKLGTLNIVKDYSELYLDNNHILLFVSLIEFVILILISLFSYIIINRVTKPMEVLTKAIKGVGQGDYDIDIKVKGKDEIAILSREFINMKDKIKNQIETINEEKIKVENLEKGRKSFFDNVTHEMKTPLTAISGYAQMIKDEMVDDKEFDKRAIERIYLESERLHNLILELIDVSKGLSYTKEAMIDIDMKKLMCEICNDMQLKANKYFLLIESNLSEGIIYGEENRIRQLLINIIDNAIKYSMANGMIKVNSFIENTNYVFNVSSMSGPIDDNVYKHIFEPFITSKNAKEKDSRGLGLYLCNEIVKDHDGSIEIINNECVEVVVKLPIHENLLC